MPSTSGFLSMLEADTRDADFMRDLAMGRPKLLTEKRMMILSGLAAFQRECERVVTWIAVENELL